MRNAIKQTACALAVLATTSGSVLAVDFSVSVSGSIAPTACKPTIANDGKIEYGTLQPTSLKKDALTFLPRKSLDFSIACSGPSKVAIMAWTAGSVSALNTDGTLSVIARSVPLMGRESFPSMGLGLTGEVGIGGFGVGLVTGSFLGDGVAVNVINAPTDRKDWTPASGSVSPIFSSVEGEKRYVSWATITGKPEAFTNVTGKFEVQAYINKGSELNFNRRILMSGKTTIELVYL